MNGSRIEWKLNIRGMHIDEKNIAFSASSKRSDLQHNNQKIRMGLQQDRKYDSLTKFIAL